MKYHMESNIKSKCKKIKIVLSDVDGVLTDGGMYYTDKGDIMKKFHVRDGMGVTLLRKKQIQTILITKEKTKIVKEWAKRMKIEKLYDGVLDKKKISALICKKYQLSLNEIAYIGDDVNDIELLKIVGLSAVPNDAIIKAKKVSHYVCKSSGGKAAFREFADLILSQKRQ